MTIETILSKLKETFGAAVGEPTAHSPKRIYVSIEGEKLVPITQHLMAEQGMRFSIATGSDLMDHFELLYHFSFDPLGTFITLRVTSPKKDPRIESLAPYMKAAEWIEREIHELLGIEFLHHPNMQHLLLRDDWPKETYPLRKDFDKKKLDENYPDKTAYEGK